jgi:SAM-dependent methyltransferase
MDITWSALLETLWEPWYLMLVTLTFIPQTLLKIFRQGQFATLASWHAFRDAWFANTWAALGPQFAEGRALVVKELLSRAHGVVLDIGPGAGNWVHLYSNPAKGGGRMTKVFGVEPNLEQHASLRRKVREAGLEGVYEIVGVGAEELGGLGLGIGKGSVDTVVTKQVMCSVPGPERLVKELYGYLKPGGVWIMYEHVKTKEGGWVGWYQGTC